MTKTVTIDGREVTFRATAAVPRLYRMKFGRDIMQDMRDIKRAVERAKGHKETIPVKMLEVFENVAFLMARHADPEMREKTVEDWLDTFETFSIYQIFPVIEELWRQNLYTAVEAKKKHAKLSGK